MVCLKSNSISEVVATVTTTFCELLQPLVLTRKNTEPEVVLCLKLAPENHLGASWRGPQWTCPLENRTNHCTRELRTSVIICTRSTPRYSSTDRESPQASTHNWGFYPQLLASGKQSAFSEGVTLVRSPTPRSMCVQHWLDYRVVFFPKSAQSWGEAEEGCYGEN